MLKKAFILITIMILSISMYAVVNCPAAQIEHIQVEQTSILFKQKGQQWHRLGFANVPSVDAMFKAMLAAQMTEKKVIVRFPDGFNCFAFDIKTDPLMVRTLNQ